ncbi:rCG60682, isoform CRA_b [Rattus norvegicus]|uniref:RCG60682, isoform CRA_b n=1 Tax=Rattus norvegicus TaxID=10116 RepID=A6JJY6_RAT|nr:rCG60682, isoform CRA_b [Rattus norvegicus]EDL97004.1 rCG60682, isoform CRA_b [Rattus norvegicus]
MAGTCQIDSFLLSLFPTRIQRKQMSGSGLILLRGSLDQPPLMVLVLVFKVCNFCTC